MSELDNAMDQHIEYIVYKEQRNFSVVDFRRFEVDGKEYRMTDGTYRNKIMERKKAGKLELDVKSGTVRYTLAGHKFGKPMTAALTGGYLIPGSLRRTSDAALQMA